MLPIYKENKLSFEKITDCWSREIHPPRSREELLDFLEAAWWRGELKADTSLTRLVLLKSMFRSARTGDSIRLVFVTQENSMRPKGIELSDGGLLFHANDLWPRISVPSNDPENWIEASCTSAFEVLAQKPSRTHYPHRAMQFLMMEIDRNQFMECLRANGLDLPKFWGAPLGRPQGMEEEVQSPTGVPPVIAQGVGHGADDAAPKRRFGPEHGTLRRYAAADRALFPELERIMADEQMSRSAAARELARAGRISGVGTPDSRAKRLAALHKCERAGS
jgi:hypothetical protein